MQNKLFEKIKQHEENFGGRIGLYAINLATGETLKHRHDEVFGTASTIKVPLLMTYFRKCQEGMLDFSTTIQQKEEYVCDIPGESGVMKKIPFGASIPMEVIAMLMIYLSDNMATNVFLTDFIPKELFNSTMKGLGYGSTRLTAEKLNKDLFFQSTEDIGYSTPEELGRILSDIISYKMLENKYAEKLLEYMSMSYLAHRLTRRLPHHARRGEEAIIERYGSKAGTYTRLKVVNDIAFAVTKDGQQIISTA